MTLSVQLMTMIAMILGGVYIGFAVDTYHRIAYRLRRKQFLKYFLDVHFWLLQTAILFYVLYRVNYGELRVYVFLACLLGISIYAVVFRKVYSRVLEVLINIVKALVHWTVQAVNVLVVQPVWWLVNVLYTVVKGTILFILRMLSYPLNWLGNLLKWLLPEKFIEKVSQSYAFCSTIINKLINLVKKTVKKWR